MRFSRRSLFAGLSAALAAPLASLKSAFASRQQPETPTRGYVDGLGTIITTRDPDGQERRIRVSEPFDVIARRWRRA